MQRAAAVASGISLTGAEPGAVVEICRRLAGLMHGAISVESQPGHGSVFTLVLTLTAVAAQTPSPVAPALPTPTPG